MTGYTYGDNPPTRPCPYCQTICDADFVDIGVGFTQCGPYTCPNCGASEIGPHDVTVPLSAEEIDKGWYKPGSPPGSSANVIGGKHVSHQVMRDTYKRHFTGNPLHADKSYVEGWYKTIRKRNR